MVIDAMIPQQDLAGNANDPTQAVNNRATLAVLNLSLVINQPLR
jgi:hypothetical protein